MTAGRRCFCWQWGITIVSSCIPVNSAIFERSILFLNNSNNGTIGNTDAHTILKRFRIIPAEGRKVQGMRKATGIFMMSIVVLSGLLLMVGCGTKETAAPGSQRNQLFDYGWKFVEDDIPGAESPGFDDSDWRTVDLPHDCSVEDNAVQDSMHIGPFNRGMDGGPSVGYLRGGTGWYRKWFPSPGEGRQVTILFDGVQSEAEVWVNGREVGNHVYGYTPFYFNITPYLNSAGENNLIAVKVVNPELNSRWFAGAGIYRHVWLSETGTVSVDVWGVSVTTPDVSEQSATVNMEVSISSTLPEDSDVSVQAELVSPNGARTVVPETMAIIRAGTGLTLQLSAEVEDPDLWDVDMPAMYTAVVTVVAGGETVDVSETAFGIRSIEYSAKRGFLLNGSEVLMKGACLHHDNGLLGAAAFDHADERRVRIMKENGYNAIRTSHNPPSQSFLDACDRLGMLVIDESFDQWEREKNPNDYHQYFKEWWQRDIDAMILRDRNHPSVIMWSIGNEINERGDSLGLAIAREMTGYIHEIEPTRPVTQAICRFWDHPGREWDATAPAFAIMDVGGYNYQWMHYPEDHDLYPDRIMVQTESAPMEAYESWEPVESQPYVIGDFVWTGMDYLGESGIGHAFYRSGEADERFSMPWPWYVAWCGDIDITGNKKPQSYYRDVLWGESRLEMAVHEPIPARMTEQISYWGWPNEMQSWNWSGNEGKSLQVSVYSNYPEVRLELNGRVIGSLEISRDMKYKTSFDVPYEPGELKVIGMENGRDVESRILRTTGVATALKLTPERTSIPADRGEVAYVAINIVDIDASTIPDAVLPVDITISGPGELIAAGNASPEAGGSLRDGQCSTFRGKAQVIIRSTGETGEIRVMASSGSLRAETVINAE